MNHQQQQYRRKYHFNNQDYLSELTSLKPITIFMPRIQD
uniref:Uncharacterized protein n=1 Tax=Arundo donax TaxID=35708 RepID=A0A0A8ZKP1_ARUDO